MARVIRRRYDVLQIDDKNISVCEKQFNPDPAIDIWLSGQKRQPACFRKKRNHAASENQAISSTLTSVNSEFFSKDKEVSEDDEEYYSDTEEVVKNLCLREVEEYKELEVFNSEPEYDI